MLGPYWIDALSIDQANKLERNHQVAQMGRIYSNAMAVYLWLGEMPQSLSPLVDIIQNATTSTFEDLGTIVSNKDILKEHIIENKYWSRAWVTQEILLAREVKVWLGAKSIDFKSMISGLESFYLIDHGEGHTRNHFSQFVRSWSGAFQPDKLITLLAQFHNKECDNQHDRIYSLLSLCSEADRRLDVDYDVARTDLAIQVLRQCRESLCICSAAVVAQTLGPHGFKPGSEESSRNDVPYLEFDVVANSVKSKVTRWLLYCFDYKDTTASSHYRNSLDFQDTCESISLADFRMAWNENTTTHPNLIRWTHSEAKTSRNFNLGKLDGPHVIARGTKDGVFTFRIPFWLLATILPQPVELCRHAKSTRVRRRAFQTRYPRIRWSSLAADHELQELPPLDSSISLPEHLARIEIKDSDSSEEELETFSQPSSGLLSPWASQEQLQSTRLEDDDIPGDSKDGDSKFGLDAKSTKPILVYKYRSGAKALEVTNEQALSKELDRDSSSPFIRVTKKPIPRGQSRLDILGKDLLLPDERDERANHPALNTALANVGLPTSAKWKHLLLGSYENLYIVSKSEHRNSRRRRMSTASDSDSDLSELAEALASNSKQRE